MFEQRRCVRPRRPWHAVFERQAIDAVVHFAAHKAVGESAQKPLEYYRNNLGGLINVAQAMQRTRREDAGVQLIGHRLRQPARRCRSPKTHRCRPPTPTARPS